MEKYEEVVLEVIQFESEDIIVTSGEDETPSECFIDQSTCPTNT